MYARALRCRSDPGCSFSGDGLAWVRSATTHPERDLVDADALADHLLGEAATGERRGMRFEVSRLVVGSHGSDVPQDLHPMSGWAAQLKGRLAAHLDGPGLDPVCPSCGRRMGSLVDVHDPQAEGRAAERCHEPGGTCADDENIDGERCPVGAGRRHRGCEPGLCAYSRVAVGHCVGAIGSGVAIIYTPKRSDGGRERHPASTMRRPADRLVSASRLSLAGRDRRRVQVQPGCSALLFGINQPGQTNKRVGIIHHHHWATRHHPTRRNEHVGRKETRSHHPRLHHKALAHPARIGTAMATGHAQAPPGPGRGRRGHRRGARQGMCA